MTSGRRVLLQASAVGRGDPRREGARVADVGLECRHAKRPRLGPDRSPDLTQPGWRELAGRRHRTTNRHQDVRDLCRGG